MAEYRYLDKVKWLDMYGVDLHPVLVSGTQDFFIFLFASWCVRPQDEFWGQSCYCRVFCIMLAIFILEDLNRTVYIQRTHCVILLLLVLV